MDASDWTPAIREFKRAQESAARKLRRHVAVLAALDEAPLREEHRYHRVLALVHQICASILTCEEAALTRQEIVAILEPVRPRMLKIAHHLLAPGGLFFFTNIAEGSPYRPLADYFGDWRDLEKLQQP